MLTFNDAGRTYPVAIHTPFDRARHCKDLSPTPKWTRLGTNFGNNSIIKEILVKHRNAAVSHLVRISARRGLDDWNTYALVMKRWGIV
jgi:hypothetical protein